MRMKKSIEIVGNKNHLYYGDNLDILRKYTKNDSIDLCYIDPPFNSKRNYNQIYNNIGKEDVAQAQAFIDTWTWDDASEKGLEEICTNSGGVFTSQTIELIIGLEKVLKKGALLAYLISITQRVAEIYRVLKPTGSFYLHCDPTASHYLKIIIDSIFCSRTGIFQSEIIWRRTAAHNKSERFAPIHDVILFYTKSNNYTWNNPRIPYMKEHVKEYFIQDENGYRTNYYGNVLTGSGLRGGESGKEWKGINPSSKGRHWAIPGKLVEELGEDLNDLSQHEKLDRLFENGYIKFYEGQVWPIYEHYIDFKKDGPAIPDIWSYQPYTQGLLFESNYGIDEDVRWLGTKDKERLGYPTQKPEGLLERIINSSTNKGDLILDAYCGCGTTIAVAEKLDRKWIGIDITYQSISLILKRLEDTYGKNILEKVELTGVPHDLESAEALAHKKEDKLRKEFEKWVVLTFTNNHAAIHEKKGGDQGIDGIGKIADKNGGNKIEYKSVLFSAKSDKKLNPSVIRDLNGTMDREKAVMGFVLTLYPMPNLVKESKKYGHYSNSLLGHQYQKIQVFCVDEILAGNRFDLPEKKSVLKSAKQKSKNIQSKIDF
jgi:DNA modification methylase